MGRRGLYRWTNSRTKLVSPALAGGVFITEPSRKSSSYVWSEVKRKSLSRVWLFPTPFSRPEYWSGYLFPSPGNLPKPGIKPRSPTLQADSLPAKAPGKPKNIGVGRLSLLQQISQIQEFSQGLLHCRCTLYQPSIQGKPFLEYTCDQCSFPQ